MNMVTKAMEQGSDGDPCFLDCSKAFGSFNHQIICAYLAFLGVSDQRFTYTWNFLAARTFQVCGFYVLYNKAVSAVMSWKAASLAHSQSSS